MNALATVLVAQEYNSASRGIPWERLLAPEAIVFLVGGAIAICAIVAVQVRKIFEARGLQRLKEDMVERGFTADEIARVVDSGREAPAEGPKKS